MRKEDLKNWKRDLLEDRYIALTEENLGMVNAIMFLVGEVERLNLETDKIKYELSADELISSLNKHIKQKFDAIPFDDENIDYDALILELQNQHHQDCIRIDELTTAVHVLAGLYSELRKNVGMD